MGKKRRYRSTKKRMRDIIAIVEAEYEPGDQNRCYAAIWRRLILPEFGICYKTLLSYLGVPPSELEEEPEKEDDRQLRLFDYEDG